MPGDLDTIMRTHEAGQTIGIALRRPAVVVTLLIGMAIAFLMPFDANIAALTGDSGIVRAGMTAVLVVLGTAFAQRAGLRFEGHGSHSPALVGVTAALVMTAYILLLDGVLFRSILPKGYIEFLQAPLAERYVYFMLRAFNENIVYRLFVFSALLWLTTLAYRPKPIPAIMIAGCMVIAQVVNIWPNVLSQSEPQTAAMLGYDVLRYVVPGVAWAILYLRNGFVIAELASVGCHLFLQPAFGALI